MMTQDKVFNVNISVDDIQKILLPRIKGDNAEKLCELILAHICKSNVGMEQLFKALLNIYPEIKYKVGDFVYVPIDNTSSYNVDKLLTEKLPTVKNKLMLCQIINIDVYDYYCYTVQYEVIKTNTTIPSKVSQTIAERYIDSKAEDVLDILEQLDNLKADNIL